MTFKTPPSWRSSSRSSLKSRFNDIRQAAVIVVFVLLALWLFLPALMNLLFTFVSFILFHALGVLIVLGGVYFYVRSRLSGNPRRPER